MAHIENRWTWGNVLTLAGVGVSVTVNIVAIVWWAAQMDAQIKNVQRTFEDQKAATTRRLDLQDSMLSAYDRRLRDTELNFVRLDEKVTSTLDIVREVRDVVKAR